jgi:hypothetical protein
MPKNNKEGDAAAQTGAASRPNSVQRVPVALAGTFRFSDSREDVN